MPRFRPRRHYRAHSPRKLHPLAIVGICLGGAILLAVIIGNLLNLFLDDEAYRNLTDGKPEEETPPLPEPTRKVPTVCVYPFSLGDPTDSLFSPDTLPPPALSVSLNTPLGSLLYTSPVSEHQGKVGKADVPLAEAMLELKAVVPYISGVFYPQALKEESSDLVYAVTLEEAALLREFASSGASEILLTGLSIDASNRSNILFYINRIREILPSSVSLGISVSYAEATAAPEILSALKNAVDFLALDLQGVLSESAEEQILAANYYLVQHEMRLLLSSDQAALISIASATLSDFQILQAPPIETPAQPTPEATP